MTKQARPKSLFRSNGKNVFNELSIGWENNQNTAIISDNTSFSYDMLYKKVKEYADKLSSLGVTQNTKVLFLIGDKIHFTIAILAVMSLDAVPMPVYVNTGHDKVRDIANKYEVNFIICDSKITIENIGEMVFYDTAHIYFYSNKIDDELTPVSLILFSSGTTNIPKAIMLTAENIISNVSAISEYLKCDENDSVLLIKNVNHSSTIIGEIFVCLYCNCRLVFTERITTAGNICSLINEHKITVFFSVPTILINLAIKYR